MRIKKYCCAFFVLAISFTAITFGGCSYGRLTINDKNGDILTELKSANADDNTLDASDYNSYLNIVLNEAVGIFADKNSCTTEKASELLFGESYVIDTCFDRSVSEAIKEAYSESAVNKIQFGCAVTDLRGGLCAAFSSDWSSDADNVTVGLSPYSTLKPISVYAPAIESGTAWWSKQYKDSYYKELVNDDGNTVKWPENATGIYSEENTSINKALKESLNTVAVKCLAEYGAFNSIQFMKNKLDMNLKYEYEKALNSGEEEVIGNIAMGYLYDGVSVVDMAGYYQMFANGGKYYAPCTIEKITDSNGNVVYERFYDAKQIISEQTAFVMNRMLREVVTDGTGKDADIKGLEICGKTGTGTADDCHWFVGVIPQYSCAVWHGAGPGQNLSPSLFKEIFSKIKTDSSLSYPKGDSVKQLVYCKESGMQASAKCRRVDMGYYLADKIPDVCKVH